MIENLEKKRSDVTVIINGEQKEKDYNCLKETTVSYKTISSKIFPAVTHNILDLIGNTPLIQLKGERI